MKTQRRLAEALKTMMAETPLEEISVTLLSKKCGINRQTFYYHFHDVYDLLTLVFLNEKLEKVEKEINPHNLFVSLYKYYEKNSKFIDATLNSAGKDLFVEFVYNNCYTTFLKILNSYKENKKITPNERKAIARFYGYAFANSIVFYFTNSKNKSLEKFIQEIQIVPENFLELAMDKFVTNK